MRSAPLRSAPALLALALVSCAPPDTDETLEAPEDDEEAFASATSVLLDGAIDAGVVIGPAVPPGADPGAHAEAVVRKQLRYAVGYLNGRNGSPSLDRTIVESVEATGEDVGAGLAAFKYKARLVVALDKIAHAGGPSSLDLILPRRVDNVSLAAFVKQYKTDCAMGLNLSPTVENYWYYYRPEAFYCPLKAPSLAADKDAAVSIPMALSPRPEGPTTYPEYDLLWQAGRLRYTGIFMRVDSVFGDVGEESMAATARYLIQAFGEPTIVVPQGLTQSQLKLRIQQNRLEANEVRLTFASASGPIDVTLFLLESLQAPDVSVPAFIEKYDEILRSPGVIAFNGHASYGVDVERFSSLGSVGTGAHHLFVLNACDSFAYEAPALREAHRQANAASATPDGFFDLVTNAMPAPAYDMPAINMAFVVGAASKTRSYSDILSGADAEFAPHPGQRAVVVYDEDNLWKPLGGSRIVHEQGKLTAAGQWRHLGPYVVREGGQLVAKMTGLGDADLYVKRGAQPSQSNYDCRPYKGGSDETCAVGDGQVHVSVRSFSATSAFALELAYDAAQ
jgi:hypothetical protein